MTTIPIYTIGYGNRSLEQFVEILQKYQIAFVIDVRSQPYSRFNQQFSKDNLEKHLKLCAIRYVFMGDTLGGRPKDETCYVNGKVDYATLSGKAFYQEGIARLRTAWEKQLRVAVMCSELKPEECHRGKLIGNTLMEQKIDVAHIDEAGNVKQQDAINHILTGGQLSLFGPVPMHSKNKYSSSEK